MAKEKYTISEAVAKFLGIDNEYDSEDDFKKAFEDEFTRKSLVPDVRKATGELYGKIKTDISRMLKDAGVEISRADWDDKEIVEVLQEKISKLQANYKDQIESLETRAEEPSKEIKTLQEKLAKREQKIKEIEDLHNETLNEFSSYKDQTATEKKNWIIDHTMRDVNSKIPWSSELEEKDRVYYQHKWTSSYTLDLDENNKPILLNKDGERVKSKSTTGTFLTPDEAALELATELGMVKKNENPQEKKIGVMGQPQPGKQDKPLGVKDKIYGNGQSRVPFHLRK